MDNRQLHWVQRNRRLRDSAAPLGVLAKSVLDSRQVKGAAWKRRLLGLLEEHAGRELLEHAEPVSIRSGVLTFQVREPVMLYHLRVHWEQQLLKLLQAELPAAGINVVRFRCGTG